MKAYSTCRSPYPSFMTADGSRWYSRNKRYIACTSPSVCISFFRLYPPFPGSYSRWVKIFVSRRFGSREDGFPLSEKYHRRNFGFYTVFFIIQKKSRFFFAFPIGQGDRVCGARVLPSKAKMRQTLFASASSFFILLVPYPARSARRLPRGEDGDTGGTPFPSSPATP